MEEQAIRKREEIEDRFKWKLEDMFESDDAWEREHDRTLELAQEAAQMQGTLADSGQQLLMYLKRADELSYHTARLYVYANERYHQDTKVSFYQALANKAEAMMVTVSSAVAFAEPELLTISQERMENFYKEEPKLEQYRRYLSEVFRVKEHTLSPEEEALLAEAGELAAAPNQIFSMLNDADIVFRSVSDYEGRRIPVTHGSFLTLLHSKDRHIRKHAFQHVYESYEKLGNTIAAIFLAQLKKERFYAKARNYSSVRAMHLDRGKIPEAVYDNLIGSVRKALPVMHRYVAARKRILGLEELHTYDLYVPLVDDVDRKYTFEEARKLVTRALAPMGEEYLVPFERAFDEGWIDVYENENKRSGAYSWSAYGTHPYVLLNYQGDLQSVFTLAHEMGHAMHSYFSNESQPVTYSDYLIFVAEVASICNESLLLHDLMEQSTDEAERQYLINYYLEQFRTTLFRQTMFADFEHQVHQKLAAGEPLTKESINALYRQLNIDYYGPELVVDGQIDMEWMRIPHFYSSYYVYQYATGMAAAVAFSDKIIKEGAPAVRKYIDYFLKGGCSKDPIDLLADAGVDMSTPQPVEDALAVFEQYVTALEEIM